MGKYNTSEKIENERAKYKVKCECGHTIVFYPSIVKNKLICRHCGHYIYKNEKERFKELMKGKLK